MISVDFRQGKGLLAASFIVEVVDGLDLKAMTSAYGGRGSAAYHPRLLLSLLIYGYSSGVFSSRGIEQATYDSVAFRFIAAGSHPDHDTLAIFGRRFLDELAELFVQVFELARDEATQAGHHYPGGHQSSGQLVASQHFVP